MAEMSEEDTRIGWPPNNACGTDHDGCVVCSDAGIPAWVVAVEGSDALCHDVAGKQTRIAVELVAPVHAGEILLTHGGVAIGRVSEQEDVDEIRRRISRP